MKAQTLSPLVIHIPAKVCYSAAMSERIKIDGFRVEPVKQDARHLITSDFKMVGKINDGTPALRAAFDSGEITNFRFIEDGEEITFPAIATFFDASHGIVTAVLRPAGAPS
jgi:hypothetical protein